MQPINHATTLGNDMIEIYTSMPGFILSIHSHTIEPVQKAQLLRLSAGDISGTPEGNRTSHLNRQNAPTPRRTTWMQQAGWAVHMPIRAQAPIIAQPNKIDPLWMIRRGVSHQPLDGSPEYPFL